MEEPNGTIKHWRPYPSWWYGLGGAAILIIASAGLKYLLNGALRFSDVLPWVLGGVGWFAVSAYLGWVSHRDRKT